MKTELELSKPPHEAFAILLKNIRQGEQLSEDQFAKTIRFSPKRILQLETGQLNPPVSPRFYRNLLNNPNTTEFSVHLLLAVAGAHPRLLEKVFPESYRARKVPGIRRLVAEDPSNPLSDETWQQLHRPG